MFDSAGARGSPSERSGVSRVHRVRENGLGRGGSTPGREHLFRAVGSAGREPGPVERHAPAVAVSHLLLGQRDRPT